MILAMAVGTLLLETRTPDLAATTRSLHRTQCGIYCLYVALSMLEKAPDSISVLEDALGDVTPRGYTVQQLVDAAQQFGASTAAVRTTPENLLARREQFACIALLKHGHFVLIRDIRDGNAEIIDPPRADTVPLSTLLTQWDGTAVLISDQPLESEELLVSRLRRAALSAMILKGVAAAFLIVLILVTVRTVRRRRTLPSRE